MEAPARISAVSVEDFPRVYSLPKCQLNLVWSPGLVSRLQKFQAWGLTSVAQSDILHLARLARVCIATLHPHGCPRRTENPQKSSRLLGVSLCGPPGHGDGKTIPGKRSNRANATKHMLFCCVRDLRKNSGRSAAPEPFAGFRLFPACARTGPHSVSGSLATKLLFCCRSPSVLLLPFFGVGTSLHQSRGIVNWVFSRPGYGGGGTWPEAARLPWHTPGSRRRCCGSGPGGPSQYPRIYATNPRHKPF